jgi:hypothetical protein
MEYLYFVSQETSLSSSVLYCEETQQTKGSGAWKIYSDLPIVSTISGKWIVRKSTL